MVVPRDIKDSANEKFGVTNKVYYKRCTNGECE